MWGILRGRSVFDGPGPASAPLGTSDPAGRFGDPRVRVATKAATMALSQARYVIAALAVGLALCGNARGQLRVVRAHPGSTTTDRQKAPPPLVPSDIEVTHYLELTEELLADGQTDKALRNLQALMAQQQVLFVPADDGRRYISLRQRLNELISTMSPEAVARYRRLYDPPARELYERSLATGDEGLLRRIVRDYAHTSVAPEAQKALGYLAFDRGGFSEAGRYWSAAAERTEGDEAASLLAKAAVAHHLAGHSAQADAVQQRLAEEFGESVVNFGGREEPALSAVRRLRKRPAPVAAAAVAGDWPGYGGLAGRPGVMPRSETPSLVDWRFVCERQPDGSWPLLATHQDLSPSFSGVQSIRLSLGGGHVVGRATTEEGIMRYVLPPYVSPVVSEGRVVFRTEQEVVACALAGGEVLWRRDLPMRREKQPATSTSSWGLHNISKDLLYETDAGRYWLAAGGVWCSPWANMPR